MAPWLLKKTGAGNLFMVFGEPYVDLRTAKNGEMIVEIKGLDIYDPTTGQIRSSATDDLACWFLDTNYNGENFFVRHAYFTGSAPPGRIPGPPIDIESQGTPPYITRPKRTSRDFSLIPAICPLSFSVLCKALNPPGYARSGFSRRRLGREDVDDKGIF